MTKYALDEQNNLIRGDLLTFAYSGSGVATLIDKAGTGYRVAVGTRNLKAIDGDTLVLENDAEPAGDQSEPDAPTAYSDLTKRELLDALTAREIAVDGHPNKDALIALLVADDEA